MNSRAKLVCKPATTLPKSRIPRTVRSLAPGSARSNWPQSLQSDSSSVGIFLLDAAGRTEQG